MSKKGIKLVAGIFTEMQLLRGKLLSDINDKQDILLGQMLEKGKDAMKVDFIRITSGKYLKH